MKGDSLPRMPSVGGGGGGGGDGNDAVSLRRTGQASGSDGDDNDDPIPLSSGYVSSRLRAALRMPYTGLVRSAYRCPRQWRCREYRAWKKKGLGSVKTGILRLECHEIQCRCVCERSECHQVPF